jgi:uncharacterized protein YukE
LQRGAAALARASTELVNHVRTIRAALSGMSHFRGPQADRFRANVEQVMRQVDADAGRLDESARALKKFATDAANLRI